MQGQEQELDTICSRATHMLRISQEVQVGAGAVGPAMRVLEDDGAAVRSRHVHEGCLRLQVLAGGPSGASVVLKVDERLCENANTRFLGVRACCLDDDVAQGQLLRLQRPVAAIAGVDVNNQTMAGPPRGTALQAIVRQS